MVPWYCKDAGVYIDVFPIDNVSDDEEIFQHQCDKIQKCWLKSVTARTALGSFSRDKTFLFNFKLLVKKILYRNATFAQRFVDLQMNYSSSCIETGKTNHWSQLGCLDGYEYHDSADFVSTSLFPFEDTEVMVMNGYDNILSKCYGNYMQLPPESQGVGHCNDMTKFYWKKQ